MTETPTPEQPDEEVTEEDLTLITGGAETDETGRFSPRDLPAEQGEAGRFEPRDLGDS